MNISPNAIDRCECFNFNAKAANTPIPIAASSGDTPNAKRKRVEPSSLSEQEQIALAIGNSLREMSTANDDNQEIDSSADDDDDDASDYENFDDESSSQSFAKGPLSQTVSEHSNSNAASRSEIVECDTNIIESTSDITESYENYLGDQNGMYFIRCFGNNQLNTVNKSIVPLYLPTQIQKRGYSCAYQTVIDTLSSGLVQLD